VADSISRIRPQGLGPGGPRDSLAGPRQQRPDRLGPGLAAGAPRMAATEARPGAPTRAFYGEDAARRRSPPLRYPHDGSATASSPSSLRPDVRGVLRPIGPTVS
jgi:hypothetical protein